MTGLPNQFKHKGSLLLRCVGPSSPRIYPTKLFRARRPRELRWLWCSPSRRRPSRSFPRCSAVPSPTCGQSTSSGRSEKSCSSFPEQSRYARQHASDCAWPWWSFRGVDCARIGRYLYFLNLRVRHRCKRDPWNLPRCSSFGEKKRELRFIILLVVAFTLLFCTG